MSLLSLFPWYLFSVPYYSNKRNNSSHLSVINHRIHLDLLLEIVLLFTGQRRSSVDPDRALQEALRTRLRVVESNSQDVIQLFKVSDSQT